MLLSLMPLDYYPSSGTVIEFAVGSHKFKVIFYTVSEGSHENLKALLRRLVSKTTMVDVFQSLC